MLGLDTCRRTGAEENVERGMDGKQDGKRAAVSSGHLALSSLPYGSALPALAGCAQHEHQLCFVCSVHSHASGEKSQDINSIGNPGK
jgi:hypothetical protein